MTPGWLARAGGMFAPGDLERAAAQTQELLRAARAQRLIPPPPRPTAAKRPAGYARAPVTAARPAPKVAQLPYLLAEMHLVGRIGGPDGYITAAGVHRELAQARAGYARAVLVTLNSTGGETSAAFYINSGLRLYSKANGRTVAYVPRGGQCASAATIVALGCDYVICDPEAIGFMIHAPSGTEDGSIANSRTVAENRLISLYAERTCLGSLDAIEGLIQGCGDTWMSPWEALGHAFVDEIGDAARATQVARALAAAHPSWPANVSSPRRGLLQARRLA